MPIYVIQIFNKTDNYSSFVFENFKNEEEIVEFKKENETEDEKIHSIKLLDDLAQCLAHLQFDDAVYYDNQSNFYLKALADRFGIETLQNQFPDEMSNQDLLASKVQKIIEKWLEEIEDEMEKEETERNYYSVNPEIEAAEEEMRKWDDEDPSWRTANDYD